MQQQQAPFGFWSILKQLHRSEIGVAPRVFLSLIVTCLCVGLALLGAWMSVVSTASIYMRDADLLRAFVIALGPWLFCQVLIWHGIIGWSKVPREPILATIGIFAAAAALCIGLDAFMDFMDTDYAVVGIWLIAVGCASCLWLAEMLRLRIGKPITDAENNVRVFCPKCGYSLIGLRECRCPECGETFTLDEIIRRQDYGATVQKRPPIVRSTDGA